MIDELTLNKRLIGQPDDVGVYKREVVQIIQDRVGGLCADHKSFLYVRSQNLHKTENLGGGNITSALAAFSALGLLSKTCYMINKPRRFTLRTNSSQFDVSEIDAFCHFIKELYENDIKLGIDKDDASGQKLIWDGFRNYLAHLGTVEDGKQVVAFEFAQGSDERPAPLLDARIDKMLEWDAFISDDTGRNWQVYVDVLFAKIEKTILPYIVEKIIESSIDSEQARKLYRLVVGRSDLPA